MVNNEDVRRLHRRMVSAVARLNAVMGRMGAKDPDQGQADELRFLADESVGFFSEISDLMAMDEQEAFFDNKRAKFRAPQAPPRP